MAAASTCSVRSLRGAYCDDGPPPGGHINSSDSRPLPIVPPSALASSPPKTNTNPGDVSSAIEVELASQSISALNIMGAKETVLHVTELPMEAAPDLAVIEQPSSPTMERVDESTELALPAATSAPASAKRRTPTKRKRTASPPSPSSTTPSQHVRPASRSTRRSAPPSSRADSLYSHRRAVTTSSLTPSSQPSPSDPETRRQNLLALHRESCRLFQPNGLARESERSAPSPPSTVSTPPRAVRTYSNLSTPPLSPILNSAPSGSQHRPPFPPPLRTCSAFTARDTEPISPIHPSATVIDWTSPSTRRREYKKIDRASSGVRGFWRRVAPRWARIRGDDRTPFFEEGKDGKGNYEGSVRRFRMDLPDEAPGGPERATHGLKLKRKLVVGRMGRTRSDSA